MSLARSVMRPASSTASSLLNSSRPAAGAAGCLGRKTIGSIDQVRHYNPFDSFNIPSFFKRRPRNKGEQDSLNSSSSTSSNDLSLPSTSSSTTSTQDALLQSAQSATTGEFTEAGPLDLLESEDGGRRGSQAIQGIWKEHKYSTARFKISPRKLNLLARQIAKQPVNEAILQMQFSEKRASERIKSTLALARNHAMDKGLDGAKLVVAESWVSKGKFIKRLDIKGRGRQGIKEHPQARLHVVLREGKTREEVLEEKRKKMLRSIRSAGVVRENPAWANAPINGWRW